MSKAKRNSLLLLTAAGALILILAMSLPNLTLVPGQPFSLEEPQAGVSGASGLTPGGEAILLVFRGLLALTVIFLPIYVIYSLRSKAGRRRLIGNAVLLGLLLLLADYLQKNPLNPGEQQPVEPSAFGQSDLAAQSGVPPTIFTPNPPSWLTPVIILVASVLVVVILLTVYWYLRRRAKPTDIALERLAEAAQDTIDSLQTGGDFEVSVIRCYQEMSRVVKEEKGIARETAMTAREFEDRLISKGLPQDATRTLTRLFERVRYGGMATGADEINTAVTCLTDIVDACGGRYDVG